MKLIHNEQIAKKCHTRTYVHLKKTGEFLDFKSLHSLSRWFKSGTKPKMINYFTVVICSILGINISTVGS